MGTDYAKGKVELFEDFVHDNVTNLVETVDGSGGAQDITNKHGGWWRQTIQANDTDAAMIAGEVAWEVDEGYPLVFEVRLLSSDVSVSSIFVGMSDANTESGAVVIEDEDGTLNTAPTDAIGFLLEGEQDETWQAVGVQNGTDNTQTALTGGADAADATVQTLRMELSPENSGTVRYYIDGELVSTLTSQFRSSIVMAPVAASDARNSAYTVDYDYIYVTAPRS